MAGDKFLYQNSGVITEKAALQTSAGAGDAGKVVALDSTGRIDSTMMPVGVGAEYDTIIASENLTAGNLVNIWTNAGVTNVRKADATTAGKEANGFVLSAVTANGSNTIAVYRSSQSNTQVSGLTPGASYWLATTAGGVTATPPSASGNVVQYVGKAISATVLAFDSKSPIVLA